MIERLVLALEALAASAEVQLARDPRFAARADELALDYADALRLVTDCPQIHLDPEQRDALEHLDEHLDAMRTGRGNTPWTDDTLRTSPEWARARALAGRALATLDAGRWTVDGGRWTVDGGRWTVDGGR